MLFDVACLSFLQVDPGAARRWPGLIPDSPKAAAWQVYSVVSCSVQLVAVGFPEKFVRAVERQAQLGDPRQKLFWPQAKRAGQL